MMDELRYYLEDLYYECDAGQLSEDTLKVTFSILRKDDDVTPTYMKRAQIKEQLTKLGITKYNLRLMKRYDTVVFGVDIQDVESARKLVGLLYDTDKIPDRLKLINRFFALKGESV